MPPYAIIKSNCLYCGNEMETVYLDFYDIKRKFCDDSCEVLYNDRTSISSEERQKEAIKRFRGHLDEPIESRFEILDL